MSDTSKGFSLFSGRLGLFQPRPRKLNKAAARQGGARALARQSTRKGQLKANPWQAAEIQYDQECACEAVRKIAGTRLLLRNVPALPVQDCDVADCTCSYVRYRDRREWSDDRRAFYSLQTQLYGAEEGVERRKRGGRRADDEPLGSDGLDISLDDIKFSR